jgi:hypothetical protein
MKTRMITARQRENYTPWRCVTSCDELDDQKDGYHSSPDFPAVQLRPGRMKRRQLGTSGAQDLSTRTSRRTPSFPSLLSLCWPARDSSNRHFRNCSTTIHLSVNGLWAGGDEKGPCRRKRRLRHRSQQPCRLLCSWRCKQQQIKYTRVDISSTASRFTKPHCWGGQLIPRAPLSAPQEPTLSLTYKLFLLLISTQLDPPRKFRVF